jgi:hypothetical protein
MQKDKHPNPTNYTQLIHFFVITNIELFFSEVSFTDAGNYTCIATNNYGSANASGTLTVKGLQLIFFILN